ncbi:MAG: beta-aspartyl-peptidase [Spirochaetales bacterium]|nr:beta-aspartyl-peptidase [Spirochaetales bacterium]
MILIKHADLFQPRHHGISDILIGGGSILAIAEQIEAACLPEPLEIIDAQGQPVVPGFIDNHVHITGGGGEGGFQTRTPELAIEDAIAAGVTTVIGVLGTDGVARSLETLLAKVYAIRAQGLSAWCYAGSYHVPFRTLTGSLMQDIMLVEPILGAGEIAVSDHRSSRPLVEELARIVADARVAGLLSGKAGVVNMHLGDEAAGMEPLRSIAAEQPILARSMLPTHCGRNQRLFQETLEWARQGGVVDFTTSSVPSFVAGGEITAAAALKTFRDLHIPLDRITWSSDGQGSLPLFNEQGVCTGIGIGTCRSLVAALQEAIGAGIPLEEALLPITVNPASILKLHGKGQITQGADADLAILDKDLRPATVLARGRVLLREYVLVSDSH